MKRILILILSGFLAFGFVGCGGTGAEDPGAAQADTNAGAEEASAPEPDAGGAHINVRVNYDEDAFDLMGTDYQSFLAGLNDSMVSESLDGESVGAEEADYYYILNNGVEVGLANDEVISVRVSYDRETVYPVPVLKGVGGEDTYHDAVAALGEPYYEGPESIGADGKELYTAVFYAGHFRYMKVYFDYETGYVSYIACFYAEAPVYEEAGGVKVGDSLDDLKGAYEKLYYATAYYDPSQGDPKYNRIYYTPMEDRDRGVECLEFYMYDKKVVKITTSVQDILEWRSYENVLGMNNVNKEDNMTGDRGNIVYFYDDAAGSEQVLLKLENCATEEIDIDKDGITEVIAYRPGSVEIVDYDAAAKTIISLDLCEDLGAVWSSYLGNAANVRPEYAKCVAAGFKEADGTNREEVYSVKDNVLTYIGPYSQDMFQ
jgi:hypothetical protein